MSAGSPVYVNDLDLDRVYTEHYAHRFIFKWRHANDRRFAEALKWATEQWGEASWREYDGRGGCRVHLDSPWQFYGPRVYFRDAEACFHFQLRWR